MVNTRLVVSRVTPLWISTGEDNDNKWGVCSTLKVESSVERTAMIQLDPSEGSRQEVVQQCGEDSNDTADPKNKERKQYQWTEKLQTQERIMKRGWQ